METISSPPLDDHLFLKWLKGQSISSQSLLAERKFQELLQNASQPRHVSGNGCIKLCYFIEQCRDSEVSTLQNVAYSETTCLGLFNFYLEWNEKNQNRSMRQVLELLSSLIARNPEKLVASSVKTSILQKALPAIMHTSIQPLLKPAFKSLECLLSKNALLPPELIAIYSQLVGDINDQKSSDTSDSSWSFFVAAVFYWLGPADVSPAAGKFLVTLFKALRAISGTVEETSTKHSSFLWQQWIRAGLSKHPHALENVKNYLLSPLFKIDRPGSLAFLQDLNQKRPMSDLQSKAIDAQAMLQLASMEVGKKAGLVEEPGTFRLKDTKSKKASSFVTLDEHALGFLLSNLSDAVRSLAFSVLTSSFSSTRPLSPVVLDLLQSHMGLLYADTDAKFRNEILTSTKNLIERIRGATALLVRDLDQLWLKTSRDNLLLQTSRNDERAVYEETEKLLAKHKKFLEWYINFLLGELIPTASYQRHTTALKAIALLLRSRLQEGSSRSSTVPIPVNSTTWPFTIQFFTPRSMRLLLDLLMDPFEEVRSGATDVLVIAPASAFQIFSPQNPEPELLGYNSALPVVKQNDEVEKSIVGSVETQEESPTTQPLGLLINFISKAGDAARKSGRADFSDGVARAYKLLYLLQVSLKDRMRLIESLIKGLEAKVMIAERDFVKAVFDSPVHGDFAALSFISDVVVKSLELEQSSQEKTKFWEQWVILQFQMVSLSIRQWEAVKDILCNDSPEGHLPEEVDGVDGIDGVDGVDGVDAVDTKDVLSYSFRAVHESSNLMRTIVSNFKKPWPENLAEYIHHTFIAVGTLSFIQLSTLRHRGAFSTVALTFSFCCQLTQNPILQSASLLASNSSTNSVLPSKMPKVFNETSKNKYQFNANLLQIWWDDTLECMYSQASTTRRSAGIPSLVAGIMSANAQNPSLADIMSHLVENARKPIEQSTESIALFAQLPQVHALNSIRQAFKTSHIRQKLEGYVVICVELAVDCFASDVWPIRNCGLLLFQTLADFLLGAESRDATEAGWTGGGTKVSYDKYPGLLDLLQSLLDTFTIEDDNHNKPGRAVENIFPALDIIRRAGVPAESLKSIYSKVLSHLGSKVWQVRELAARTLCALSPADQWENTITSLLEISDSSANRQHGILMAIKAVLEKGYKINEYSDTASAKSLCFLFSQLSTRNNSEISSNHIAAARFNIRNRILRFMMPALLKDSPIFRAVSQALTQDPWSVYEGPPSDLLLEEIVREKVQIYALQNDADGVKNTVYNAANSGRRNGLAALWALKSIWETNHDQRDIPEQVEELLDVISATASSNVKAEAVCELAKVLEAIDSHNPYNTDFICGSLRDRLLPALAAASISPDLEDSIILVSGHCLLFTMGRAGCQLHWKQNIRDWCAVIFIGTDDKKNLETRFATTFALTSFYRREKAKQFFGDDCILYSLLGLYNLLNDDDEGIRREASDPTRHITQKSSLSLRASDDLISWIASHYHNSMLFAYNVVVRLLGCNLLISDVSALPKLDMWQRMEDSFTEFDSLFVSEKANLYRDDIRDYQEWGNAFLSLTLQFGAEVGNKKSPLGVLIQYTLQAMHHINAQLEKYDGPFGWGSNPIAFAEVCRVLVCVNTIFAYLVKRCPKNTPLKAYVAAHSIGPEINMLEVAIDVFIMKAVRMDLHKEALQTILNRQSLMKTRLDSLLHRIRDVVTTSPSSYGFEVSPQDSAGILSGQQLFSANQSPPFMSVTRNTPLITARNMADQRLTVALIIIFAFAFWIILLILGLKVVNRWAQRMASSRATRGDRSTTSNNSSGAKAASNDGDRSTVISVD